VSTHFERLLILQERDRKISQLVRESKDIPARKNEIESRLNAQRESLHNTEENLKKETASTKLIESEIEGLKLKIAKFREQQFQIKSNVEYKALENEIATTEKKIAAQEDNELVILEAMDEHRARIVECESDLKRESEHVQQDIAALDKRAQAIEGEVHDLKLDRDEIAKDIDPDFLSRYERIMNHVGDYALVSVDNGACGGCHMKLPPQAITDAKKVTDLTLCDFCGRILYWRP
jgi:predicted  nucleic acid-binding Zn-ribbon protein